VNILLSVIKGLKQLLLHKSNNTIIPSSSLVNITTTTINTNNKDKVINEEKKSNQLTATMTSNEFLFRAKLDNVNLYKLKKHIDETHLVNKIGKFTESQERKIRNEKEVSDALIKSTSSIKNEEIIIDNEDVFNNISPTSSLRNIVNLIKCLTNSDVDGRVLVTIITNNTNTDKTIIDINSSIKFVLLNPSIYFKKVVDQTKSIILLGGTMKPFSYFTSFLFPHIEKNKINTFSCGHVVSNSSIKPLILSVGVNGNGLEFTHDKRLLKGIIIIIIIIIIMN
jgi:chromosome transmission fidelity protein 1